MTDENDSDEILTKESLRSTSCFGACDLLRTPWRHGPNRLSVRFLEGANAILLASTITSPATLNSMKIAVSFRILVGSN
jgi:hypothetical protein